MKYPHIAFLAEYGANLDIESLGRELKNWRSIVADMNEVLIDIHTLQSTLRRLAEKSQRVLDDLGHRGCVDDAEDSMKALSFQVQMANLQLRNSVCPTNPPATSAPTSGS